ncbi:MAG TPA: class I SAM-dependent methyltransferase [Vicinamibacteria bacterium]|nr:class I SAM-dependent methyltransferase [Vicinamibacteria bacterium]
MDLESQVQPITSRSPWVAAFCCPECGGPLTESAGGLACIRDEAFFATLQGVHRLLGHERQAELAAATAFYCRVRADEGFQHSSELPRVPRGHVQARIWRQRARHFGRFMDWLARERPKAQSIVDIGAGCCWAAQRLAERGYSVAALDINLDPTDGLTALGQEQGLELGIERIEADMEFLPLSANCADVVLLNGALHYARCPQNVVAEARRILKAKGALVILDSPIYRRSADGEAMVKMKKKDFLSRYGYAPCRDAAAGYFTITELTRLLERSGFDVRVVGWPSRLREMGRDLIETFRHGRRTARFPMILAQRRSA